MSNVLNLWRRGREGVKHRRGNKSKSLVLFSLLASFGSLPCLSLWELLVYVTVSTLPSHLNPGWTHRVKVGKHGSLRPSKYDISFLLSSASHVSQWNH